MEWVIGGFVLLAILIWAVVRTGADADRQAQEWSSLPPEERGPALPRTDAAMREREARKADMSGPLHSAHEIRAQRKPTKRTKYDR